MRAHDRIQDAPLSAWVWAGALSIGAGQALLLYSLKRGARGSVREFVAVCLVTAAFMFLWTRRWRWVETSPYGIAFRDDFRSRRYPWGMVGSFAIGNPANPELAYLKLRSGAVVLLPQFRTISASSVVDVLNDRQLSFAARPAAPQEGS